MRRELVEPQSACGHHLGDFLGGEADDAQYVAAGRGDDRPGSASAFIAVPVSGVRTVMLASEAAATSSPTGASAISLLARSRRRARRCPPARSSGGWRRTPCGPRRPARAAARESSARLGIEPVDPLVEHQRRPVAEQRGRDPEPLAHAEREPARAALGDGGSPASSSTSPPGRAGGRCSPRATQVIARAAAGMQRRRLQQRADLAQRAASAPYGCPHERLAPVGSGEPEDHPHRRRLAGAVGGSASPRRRCTAPVGTRPPDAAVVPHRPAARARASAAAWRRLWSPSSYSGYLERRRADGRRGDRTADRRLRRRRPLPALGLAADRRAVPPHRHSRRRTPESCSRSP